MSNFQLPAVVAVCLICALSSFEVESAGETDGTVTPASTRSPSRAKYDLSYGCSTVCHNENGYIIDDQTQKKIYVTRPGGKISCSCHVSQEFKEFVRKNGLESIPRGTSCVSKVRKARCLCRQALIMRDYLERNQLDDTNGVCEISKPNCKCIFSTRFIYYLKNKQIDTADFSERSAENADKAYEWLASSGIEVIRSNNGR